MPEDNVSNTGTPNVSNPETPKPTVNNFYYGPQQIPAPPIVPAPCNYNPPPPPSERRPLGFWSIAAICGTFLLLVAGVLTYLFMTDNGMIVLKQGEKLFNPNTSKMYEYDIDAKNIDANVTIEGYNRDIELAKINKTNCSKNTGKVWKNYTQPSVNNYYLEQTQTQEQKQEVIKSPETQIQPPVIIRQDPEPVKEKKSCKEKVREERPDGNNKDINQ